MEPQPATAAGPTELRRALGPLWPQLGAEPSSTVWAAFPSLEQPRLLVPTGSRGAAAQTIREQTRTTSGRAAIVGTLLAAAVHYGPGTALLRRRTRVGAGDAVGAGLVGRLEELLGCPLDVAVYLGHTRRNRKPVLKLYDRSGRLRAVAKVGIDALTSGLVRNEHAALLRLAQRSAARPDVVHVPRVLELLEWDGTVALVQSPLAVGHRRRHRADTADLRTTTAWLSREDAVSLAVMTTSWWATVLERVRTTPDGAIGDRLRTSVDHAAVALRDVVLAMAPWHGDLTPWNMAVAAGRPQVWDWERYAAQAPVGGDELHFGLQAIAHRGGETGAVMAAGLLDAPRLLRGIDEVHDASLVSACYALEIGSRYVAEGQALLPRGGRVATTMLDHVDRILSTRS